MSVDPIRIIFVLLLLTCGQCLPALGDFAHPGIAHSRESVEFVKAKIMAGEQPWLAAWEKLKESRYSTLDWKPKPFEHVERGPYNDPNIGSSEFSNDARAAYNHALCWALSGEEAHAKKAAQITNA